MLFSLRFGGGNPARSITLLKIILRQPLSCLSAVILYSSASRSFAVSYSRLTPYPVAPFLQ